MRSSFSQHNLFNTCPRSWYMSYIQKIPTFQDMCYANAGTAVHKALDRYYGSETPNIDETKKEFDYQWSKLKLDTSMLRLKKDEYWLMVLNGTNYNVKLTSTEFSIFYPDVVCYIDGMNSNTDELLDWKTSTRSKENEEEYKLQLKFYSWLYYRKFSRLPKKATIFYLKYNGSKGEMSFTFNMDDVLEAEKWYNETLKKMEYYVQHPNELPDFNYNYHFAPYRSMWGNGENGVLKYKLNVYGNYIQLEGPVSELLQKGIVKKFSYELKNAYWIKKNRPMANTTVCFWNEKYKILPIGFKDGLIKTLNDFAEYKKIRLELNIVDNRVFDETKVQMPDKFVNGIQLRDYQNEAVDIFIRKKIGTLELGTGAGKTEIATELIRKIGVKTLFIVDKIELLRQTKKRIEEALGIEVGVIGQGESNIKDITVATIQTLNTNIKNYINYLEDVRFVIMDECHKVAANSYVKISKYLCGTEYRLGLSGTAYRDDGEDMKIFAVVGNIIHSVNSQTLIQRGWLMKPEINFIKDYMTPQQIGELEDSCKTGLVNETMKYDVYYNVLVTKNIIRNNRVLSIVNENKNKKILILTKMIEHGQLLNQLIPNSKHLYGQTNKDERKQMFEEFVSGNFNVLISTLSIFAEGVDIPALDIVINVSANKGDVKTIQILGRVIRKLEGKEKAKYYDFYDDSRFFRLSSLSRKRALLREGHDIYFISDKTKNI